MYYGQSHERIKTDCPAFGKGCGRSNHLVEKYSFGNKTDKKTSRAVNQINPEYNRLKKNYC